MSGVKKDRVMVVGGGLGGALAANFLAQRGFNVALYEMREDIRQAEIVRGRSINLALSTRGIRALESVGLSERVMEECIPMKGRMMHDVDGQLTFQPYGTEESQMINSVSRAGLNRILLEAASERPNVEMHFEHRCLDIDLDAPHVEFQKRDGDTVKATSDVVIGADGAFSRVRRRLQRTDRFDYSQSYLQHGYKELVIPPAEGGGFRIEPNALHIWPRGGSMMIALPNADGSFTCTLFWPLSGEHSFSQLTNEKEVSDYFQRWYADAVPHMPTLVEDYLSGPPSSLVTVRCYPWSYGSTATLLGDACHAVVPFYGQGMNCAFEDCAFEDRGAGG